MTAVSRQTYHANMRDTGAHIATGIDEVLVFLRATKDEAEISSILDSAYEHGQCLVDGHLLVYDGRDFWIEPYDWSGVDPYDVDGLDFGSAGETSV